MQLKKILLGLMKLREWGTTVYLEEGEIEVDYEDDEKKED